MPSILFILSLLFNGYALTNWILFPFWIYMASVMYANLSIMDVIKLKSIFVILYFLSVLLTHTYTSHSDVGLS